MHFLIIKLAVFTLCITEDIGISKIGGELLDKILFIFNIFN